MSNATGDTTSPLGRGWYHPYMMRLIAPGMPDAEAGRIIIVTPEGSRVRFEITGTNTYEPLPGVYSILTRSGTDYVQTLRDQTQYVFNSSGQLTTIRDAQGHSLTLSYTGSPARLTSIADPLALGRTLTITYTSGLISEVGDGSRRVTYTYLSGDLKQATDVMTRTTVYTYSNHLLTHIQNPLGQLVEQTTYDQYTPAGRVISQTLLDGTQIQATYAAAKTTIQTSGTGVPTRTEEFSYSGGSTIISHTLDTVSLRETSHDENFAPGGITDSRGNSTLASFNGAGQPEHITNALGETTTAVYNSNNQPITVTDTLGRQATFSYDTHKNLTQYKDFIGLTTVYTYNVRYPAKDWLEDIKTPDGIVTRYEYNTAGLPTSMVIGYGTALAQTTTYAYDTLGRQISVTVGSGTSKARTDRTVYNPDNTVAQTIQNYKGTGIFDPARPDENIATSYGYDALGRRIWVRDTYGRYDVTGYNQKGQAVWTSQNMTGYSGGTVPATPPAYSPAQPDVNVSTFYGYDGMGRTVLVTETGILTGTFNLTTLQFNGATERVTRTEYDAFSRPVTVTLNYQPGQPVDTLPDVNVRTITQYDTEGNVAGQRDALGRWTVFEYDALNRLTKTIVNYENGNPLTVDPANTSWTDGSDTDLISVTTYRPDGQVASEIANWVDGTFTATELITDRVTLYDYDPLLGRLTATTENYDPSQTTRTDTNRRSEYSYDTAGRRQAQRDPLGQWVSQQYDQLGRVAVSIQNCYAGGSQASTGCAAYSSSTPDRNIDTETRYDELSRVFETVDPLGYVTRQTYDGVGRVLTTVQNYVDGTFSSSSPAEDVISRRAYDALGRTTTMTDPVGAVTRYAFDTLGHTTVITDPVGRVSRMGYDGSGAQRWMRTPDGRFTVTQVDGLGRVVATIANYQDGVAGTGEPADQDLITSTVYDRGGRTLRTVDAGGQATAFAYDQRDLLIGVTENWTSGTCPKEPCSVVTSYAYDRAGNRVSITDPRANVRTFVYDAADQQTTVRDELNRETAWEYNRGGLVTRRDDPRGSDFDVNYSYDGVNRLQTVSAANPTTLSPITMSYNGRGDRVGMSDGTGSTSFVPDPLGRITQITAPNTGSVSYGYNARGERVKLTYPGTGAPIVDYAYFPDGQLQSVTQSGTTLATYAYDLVGRVAQVTRRGGDASITNYQYDRADRLRAIRTTTNGTLIDSFQYELNRQGLRSVITDTIPLNPIPSPTRLKTITFEGASLTDPVTGVDTIFSPVELDYTTPIKGGYAARIPNTTTGYLRETFSDQNEVFVSFYVRITSASVNLPRLVLITNRNGGGTISQGNIALTSGRQLRLNNGTTQVGSLSTALTLGQVYRIGLRQKTGTGSNAILEAYVAQGDAAFGAPFASASNLSFTTQAMRVSVGATNNVGLDAVFDDIAIDGGGFAPASLQRIASFGAQSLAFEPNTGQTDPAVRYTTRGMGSTLFFTPDEVVLALRSRARQLPDPAATRAKKKHAPRLPRSVVRLRFQGARPDVQVEGVEQQAQVTNYLRGNDPAQWRTDQPTYSSLIYRGLYSGIDLRYDGQDGRLKSTWTVAPGADPARIRYRYQGADDVQVTADGSLQITLPAPTTTLTDTVPLPSTIIEQPPIAWQDLPNGEQVDVAVRYEVNGGGQISFALGAYDPALPLIIDPVLTYGSYLGGTGEDHGDAIARDSLGNVYVAGWTTSLDFPPAGQQPPPSDVDVFVTKVSGGTVLWSTYLGGSGDDYAEDPVNGKYYDRHVGLALDNQGQVYVTGTTRSTNFPVTAGAFRMTCQGGGPAGCQDAFVTKLNSDGVTQYSTYLGGAGSDASFAVAVDGSGQATLTGWTESSNFPMSSTPYQGTCKVFSGDPFCHDLFVTRLNAAGNGLIYSTYLGGDVQDEGSSLALDAAGQIYVTGWTESTNFPVKNAVLTSNPGSTDALVARINPAASGANSLVFSTYLGGSQASSEGAGIAVDSAGAVYVTGETWATTGFPLVPATPYQGTNHGRADAFITKFAGDGSAVLYSTYIGGSEDETGLGITTVGDQAVIVGQTDSPDLATAQAVQLNFNCTASYPCRDAFVMQLNSAGTALVGGTYLGGDGNDAAHAVTVDSQGAIYLTGFTESTNMPTAGSQPGQLRGPSDAFVGILGSYAPPPSAPTTRTTTYSYDGLQRLIGAVESPGNSYAYSYDLAGNRLTAHVNNVLLENRGYDAANQVIGWSYDDAGNLLNDLATQYTYDALSRTTSAMAGGQTRSYAYNGQDLLVSQVVSGTTTRYAQDLVAELPQVLQTQGAATTHYLYGRERLLALSGATRSWYASDALGSVRQVLSDAGIPQTSTTYDPWGQVSGGTSSTPFGFTGELQDAGGDVYLRARWYNPNAGTLTSVDPFQGTLEQPYTQHPYAYALSNPVLYTDPTGKQHQGNQGEHCPPGFSWDRFLRTCRPDWTAPPNNFPSLAGKTQASGDTIDAFFPRNSFPTVLSPPVASPRPRGPSAGITGAGVAALLLCLLTSQTNIDVNTPRQPRSEVVVILGLGSNFSEVAAVYAKHPNARIVVADIATHTLDKLWLTSNNRFSTGGYGPRPQELDGVVDPNDVVADAKSLGTGYADYVYNFNGAPMDATILVNVAGVILKSGGQAYFTSNITNGYIQTVERLVTDSSTWQLIFPQVPASLLARSSSPTRSIDFERLGTAKGLDYVLGAGTQKYTSTYSGRLIAHAQRK